MAKITPESGRELRTPYAIVPSGLGLADPTSEPWFAGREAISAPRVPRRGTARVGTTGAKGGRMAAKRRRPDRHLSWMRDTRGASTVEHVVLLCLIGIVGLAAWRGLGSLVEGRAV
ncbi:MAG: hypothetical protein ACK6CU_03545, partial [Deltaproteobacteria bacterium]